MRHDLVGWDIGGAHLKAVWLDKEGNVRKAIQRPCPLWQGTHLLRAGIRELLIALGVSHQNKLSHAVTMTGELVDLFPNRHTGVLEIAKIAQEVLGDSVQIYAGDHGFLSIPHVVTHTSDIASMNWHASACWVAKQHTAGLLVDIGSTTTDLIPFETTGIAIRWRTDAERLSHNALVYTGVIRTPLMAVAQKLTFKGLEYHVAAELFATMADVYRVLGQLPASIDSVDTADGQDTSSSSSMRRLARMIGHDLEDAKDADWYALAHTFALAQQTLLQHAITSHPQHQQGIIGLGVGHFLVEQLAEKLAAPYVCASRWIKAEDQAMQQAATICFPAFAVAQLLLYGI